MVLFYFIFLKMGFGLKKKDFFSYFEKLSLKKKKKNKTKQRRKSILTKKKVFLKKKLLRIEREKPFF